MTEETKKPRRKRRTKAQIEADKAAAAELAAKETEMESQGYEKVRMRDEHGHFVKDDPNTPENEAWEWRKKEEEEECIPCQESAMAALEAAEAAIEEEEPAVTKKAEEGYVPLTGLAKLRNKYSQRQEIDRSRKL